MEEINREHIPNFICPGAAKSGTTTLFSILETHKDIYLYRGKEIGYFGKKDRYTKGYKWYRDMYFSENKTGKISGDISTNYMTYSKVAAKRIYETLGSEVKLIFILRNPTKRAYSHYNMRKFNNLSEEESFGSLISKLDFNQKKFTKSYTDQLSNDFGVLSKKEQEDWKTLNYFFLGNYAEILGDYLEYYSLNNMLIIKFEDFIKDQCGVMERIYTFLGVENQIGKNKVSYANPSSRVKFISLHKSIKNASFIIRKIGLVKLISNNKVLSHLYYKYKNWNREANNNLIQPMSFEEENILNIYYKEDILNLQKITGQNFTEWLKVK